MRIPKSVKETTPLFKSNANKIWLETIVQEVNNLRISFKIYEGNVENLPPGCEHLCCHIIFDVKIGENLHSKSKIISGVHNNSTPYLPNSSSVVSRYNVGIYLTIASLNG